MAEGITVRPHRTDRKTTSAERRPAYLAATRANTRGRFKRRAILMARFTTILPVFEGRHPTGTATSNTDADGILARLGQFIMRQCLHYARTGRSAGNSERWG